MAELVRIIASELGVHGPQPHPVPALPMRLYLRLNAFTDVNWGLALPRAGSAAFLTSDRVFDLSRARQDLAYAPESASATRYGGQSPGIASGAWCEMLQRNVRICAKTFEPSLSDGRRFIRVPPTFVRRQPCR